MSSAPEAILEEAHRLVSNSEFDSGSIQIVKLAGDASLRRYFRISQGDSSFVLMLTDSDRKSTRLNSSH